jgi:putative ABC transport system ATP-binding protein
VTAVVRESSVVCRDIVKNFQAGATVVPALRGVSLEIRPGELTLLVGPSGCGKTTLISIIAAVLEQTSGDVRVLGQELAKLSARRKTLFRREKVGFIFQQFNLLPSLTAAENASVPHLIAGKNRQAAVRRAKELLESMSLGHRTDAYPREMSGGEQQRVAIARALIHDPELLICDEPTSALDARTGKTIMEILKEFAVASKRTAIVVTHDQRTYSYADRIIEMEDGRVKGEVDPKSAVHEALTSGLGSEGTNRT